MRRLLFPPILCLAMLGMSCGGGQTTTAVNPPAANDAISGPSGPPAFPVDRLLPGETLDGAGLVAAERNAVASALGISDEFLAGAELEEGAGISDKNDISATLLATPGESAWGMHRFVLAGQEPGVVSADANLLPGVNAASYYVGVSNFSTQRWDWHGPFTDSHVRIPLDPAADYTSGLGNCFTAVLGYDDVSLELVGVSISPASLGDEQAPAAVSGLTASAVSGAAELQWNDNAEGDLAGYRIYWSQQGFINPHAVGVSALPYLEGTTRHLLELQPGSYFIGVSALDTNGNEGPLSGLQQLTVSGQPGSGLLITAGSSFTEIGEQVELNVSGADLYDIDFDGDGSFEITDDSASQYFMPASSAGILRARVRGHDAGGELVALGGLSVLVTIANLPPFADLELEQTSIAPGQSIRMSGVNSQDLDGTIDFFEWDFDGDGNFDDDTGSTPFASHTYTEPGYYDVEMRVTDEDGDSSSAFATLTVRGASSFQLAETGANSRLQMMDVAGRPALFFINGASESLWFMRSLDERGDGWPNPTEIYDTSTVSNALSVQTVSGNPAVAFRSSGLDRVLYMRASSSDGSAWAAPVQVGAINMGNGLDMEIVNGNPAIIMQSTGSDETWYLRSSNVTGTSWNPGVKLFDSPVSGFNPQLLPTLGGPSAVFLQSAPLQNWYGAKANDADGIAWSIPTVAGDSGNDDGNWMDTIASGPGFIACYSGETIYGDQLRVSYLSNQQPSDNWGEPQIVSKGGRPRIAKLGRMNGLPFIIFEEFATIPKRLFYVEARDVYGFDWGEQIVLLEHGTDYVEQLAVLGTGERVIFSYKAEGENVINLGTVYK
ncbi:PKD domain-containing protein [bacterium]|nr:PKD domain-containing protein [bacterium]